MKISRLLILSLFTVTLTLAPVFTYAQEVTINKSNLEKLRELNNSSVMTRGTPGHDSAKKAAMDFCNVMGEAAYKVTSHVYSSIWNSATANCTFGKVVGISTTPDEITKNYNRPYVVVSDPTAVNFIWGVMIGTVKVEDLSKGLTEEEVKKISAREQSRGEDFSWLHSILNAIFVTIGNILASALAGIATLSLKILTEIVSVTTNVLQPPVLSQIWGLVRDFMNLVFILALIVMALATILQREAYNYKRLLIRLILMALLINFSKVIADTLIGVSDMLITMFVPEGSIWGFADLIRRGFITEGDGWSGFFGQNTATVWQGIGKVLTKIVALILLTVSLWAITLLMFVRLIGLWFLTVLSPVAYALNILPNTQKYAAQWWNTFIKYLIWGPVAIFFLRVAFIIVDKNGSNMFSDHMINYLFISAFVWAGFLAAKSAGMYGASAITSTAEKYMNQGSRFAVGAYGNYFWRGTAAKHLGNVATLGLAKPQMEKLGNAIGTATARIENEPKLRYQQTIGKGNNDRKKLVGTENRRAMIRRQMLDEDAMKKMSDQDIAYAIKEGKHSEDMLLGVLEHGNTKTKLAVAAAFAGNHVLPTKQFDANQLAHARQKATEFAWQHIGGKLGDLGRSGFTLASDVSVQARNTKFNPNSSFAERLKNGYVDVSRTRVPRRQRQAQGQGARGAGAAGGGGGAAAGGGAGGAGAAGGAPVVVPPPQQQPPPPAGGGAGGGPMPFRRGNPGGPGAGAPPPATP